MSQCTPTIEVRADRLARRREVLRLLLGATIATAGVAAAGAGPAPAAGRPDATLPMAEPTRLAAPLTQTLDVVRGSLLGGTQDGFWWVANERGYLREQGINFETTSFRSGAEMVAPLSNGQLDVGRGAVSAGLFNAIASGVPLKAVSDSASDIPGRGSVGLVVRQDLWDGGAIAVPADLKGRRVALAGVGVATETSLQTFLQSGGISFSDLDVAIMSFADMLTALATKTIDVAAAVEPTRTLAEVNGLGHVWINTDAMLPGHVIAVLMYSPKFATDQPDLATRLMVAYLRAVRDFTEGFVKNEPTARQAVVDILVRNTSLDQELYDRMTLPVADPNGQFPTDSLDLDQDYFLSRGEQTQRIDVAQVVDMHYAEDAVRILGPYS